MSPFKKLIPACSIKETSDQLFSRDIGLLSKIDQDANQVLQPQNFYSRRQYLVAIKFGSLILIHKMVGQHLENTESDNDMLLRQG